jgi:hypothetical protein
LAFPLEKDTELAERLSNVVFGWSFVELSQGSAVRLAGRVGVALLVAVSG